jgi:hypothetical protein
MDSAEMTEWMAEFSLRNEDAKPKPQSKQEAKMVLDSLVRQKPRRR